MKFPKTGVEHHGDDIPLSLWARRSGTDMEKVIEELRKHII